MPKISSARRLRSWIRYLKTIVIILLGLIIGTALLLWPVKVKPEQQEEFLSKHIWFDPNAGFNLDSLMNVYGQNKELPEGLELQSLLALSIFPELKETRVAFKMAPALIPIASRPNFWSFLKRKEKRKYNIWISTKSRMVSEDGLIPNMCFNGQVSMLAHELGHALYYRQLSLAAFIKFGFCYVMSSDFRAKHERTTDKLVIQRGLGEGLLEAANFFRDYSGEASEYVSDGNFLDTYYLTPAEIHRLMNKKH